MDPAVIAALALLASALQVAILRVIDYYFPKGHTRSEDQIAETLAERGIRHLRLEIEHKKAIDHKDDGYEIQDDSET